MDEKNIPVFDFTDERIFNDWKSRSEYEKLNRKQRKSYKPDNEPQNGKIAVEILNIDDEIFKCIYNYRTDDEIHQMIENDESMNLRGIYVDDFDITWIENYDEYLMKDFDARYSFWNGRTGFEGSNFGEGNINFYGANFGKGAVSFESANFGEGQLNFRGVNFGEGNLSFEYADFGEGKVSFAYANFGKADVKFDGANFDRGYLIFREANFGEGDVSFEGANFGEGDVSFHGASFDKGDVIFYRARFGGSLRFDGADFSEGNVSFEYANFGDGGVSFYRASFGEGYVSFEYASFGNGDISFKVANFGKGNVSFENTDFAENDISFQNANVQNILFYKNTFSGHVELRFNEINELKLEDCIIEKTIKCDGFGYKKLSFLGTVNLGHIYIDWDKNNVQKAIVNGEVEYYKNDESKKRNHTNEELAKQFRMLKENYRNLGRYDEEDRAYRAYMKYHTNKFPRCLLKVFKLIGGYGTQAWSILLTALLTIFGFGMLQYFFEWIEFTNGRAFSSKFWESMYFSGITFFTIGFGDVTPVNQLAGMMAVFEGFLGVTLMSYFVVALVRKLLR